MGRLDGVSDARLAEALAAVEGKRATLRVVVGINYKQGIDQTTLAEWYGVSRTTIHNWLTRIERLESDPVAEALYDDDRPGRPAKLRPAEREAVAAALRNAPAEFGFAAEEWSPPLVREHIEERFAVEYSLRHVRTLMHDLGLEWTSDQRAGREKAGNGTPTSGDS